jgi:glucosamine--fructose-6-phosphate aminotransferase (isomerizing)
MLAAALAGEQTLKDALGGVPAAVERALGLDAAMKALAERWRGVDSCVMLARGYGYATALEVALKIKETSYVVADAYSSADFLHGPIAVIERGFPALLFGAAGPTMQGLRELATTLQARGADLAVLADDEDLLALAGTPLHLRADLSEPLTPIAQVVAGQLLAYHLAVAKGYDPDAPRGLRKVTATR